MTRTFAILTFTGLLIFSSCGNETGTVGTASTDSTVIVAPPELKSINEEILKNPKDPELYHKRAKYHLASKSFEEGIADMSRAMSLDSSKAVYYLTLSDLLFATNSTGKAKQALERSVGLEPKNTEALLKLAELYLYVGKNEKSIDYINQSLKVDQYNAKAYFMKGMNFKELKDTAKAISSMQTAVELDQQYYNAYMQLGILSAAKYDKIAVDYYRNAIRIQPKSVEAWYAMGKYYQDVQDWKNAIGTYKTLLTFNNNKNALYNLGAIYMVGTKEYNKALESFTSALNIDPEYAEAHYGRGVCYGFMKDPKKAALEFQACLSIDPGNTAARRALEEL
ncbi:MAG TPA: tetratricopeptide repeat protein [Bacteroidia bacterium]|jgi:tetratricopeptide (TPR) repeat protein